MSASTARRRVSLVAGITTLALVATACGGGDEEEPGGTATGGGGTTTDGGDGGDGGDECAAYSDYMGHDGTEVSIYTTISGEEGDRYIESWSEFEDCTGITINFEGSREFETQITVRVQGGNAPDIAFIPQPGLLQTFEEQMVPASEELQAVAEENFDQGWLQYSTINDTLYGSPLDSNVKSFVWYSPYYLEQEWGYQVPETWEDMMALSEQIQQEQGIDPWCAGIGSGDATGWPATDFLEDVLLRTAGPDVYDQWTNHEIPFNDPQVVEALDTAGEILKNDDMVNGTFGGPESIATTPWDTAGEPILTGDCAFHRAANFYAANWGDDVLVQQEPDENGVFAFYLPTMEGATERPVLGAGTFIVAFRDAPEVDAVRRYLASSEWHEGRVRLGAFLSANRGVDLEAYESPIDRQSAEILTDEEAIFRFDASDLMPGAVGAGSFWRAMVDWITGTDTQTVLDRVENEWPES